MSGTHETSPIDRRDEVRKAFAQAERVVRMLQGTMSLEGQGLDRKTLHELKKMTVKELLGSK